MEQKPISINPVSLKRFTKHLCIISKKHSDREAAHEDLKNQLSKIKRISTNKKLTKTALKSEIKELEKKISLVLQKEAELYQFGKIERMMIQKLKDKIEELEQFRERESSKKDAELTSIKQALTNLQKKQDYIINLKTHGKTPIKEIETKTQEHSPEQDKEQIRKKIQELESRYASLKGKYSEEDLAAIGDKIDDLKQRL